MSQTREEVLNYVLADGAEPLPGLGLESLDAVVLCTAIQERYHQTQMPIAELLSDSGQKQRNLSIAELADFVHTHLSAAAQEPKAEQVEVTPRRTG